MANCRSCGRPPELHKHSRKVNHGEVNHRDPRDPEKSIKAPWVRIRCAVAHTYNPGGKK